MPRDIKLYYVGKFSEGDSRAQLDAMRRHFTLSDVWEADYVYCGSIAKMKDTMAAMLGKPLIVYCWDYYLWAHEGRHPHWNWGRYAKLLKNAALVLVPSAAQQRRLKECLDIDAVVVHSGVTTYEAEVRDGGFILDPLRYYPEENRDWAERAADKLGIPIIHSEHQYTNEEFQDLVASCTFMTSCVREASTGALTLMEGLYLGKPSLVSDSPYMGAVDYLGAFGHYFKYNDFEDLCEKMNNLWTTRPKVNRKQARKHLENFTYDKMAENIKQAICTRFT